MPKTQSPDDELALISQRRAVLLAEFKTLSLERSELFAKQKEVNRSLAENEQACKRAAQEAKWDKARARGERALTMRLQGLTYREIGKELSTPHSPNGISAENARQIVHKSARRMKHPRQKEHPLRAALEQRDFNV